CVGALVAICGCVSLSRQSQAEIYQQDLALYGAAVVRPGMTKADVDSLLTSQGQRCSYVIGGQFVNCIEFDYSALLLFYAPLSKFDDPTAVVLESRPARVTQESDYVATHTDAQLRDILHVGMLPLDVVNQIGRPVGGYENERGKLVMVHPQPGIEITYENGRL